LKKNGGLQKSDSHHTKVGSPAAANQSQMGANLKEMKSEKKTNHERLKAKRPKVRSLRSSEEKCGPDKKRLKVEEMKSVL
jgi:hypothetical protein